MKRRSQKTKARGLIKPSTSSYAKKHKYLIKHGGFGFQYLEPKPWK